MFTNSKIVGKVICFTALLLLTASIANGISDPRDEVPTDTSVSIKIKDFSFKIEEKGGGLAEVTLEVKGETTGKVNHCGIAFITYFKNGTTNYNGIFMQGPIKIPSRDAPIEFVGTGKNGSWSSWRFYNRQIIEKDKIGINESQLPYVNSFIIWARAYVDENNLLWNQSSKNVTEIIKNEVENLYREEEEAKKSSSPLFLYIGISSFIAVIAIALFISQRKKGGESEEEPPFRVGDYILYVKEIPKKSGGARKMYFFSKKKRGDAQACKKPEGYEVEINKKTGVPFLKKVK